jgi:hypothetical protein
VSTSSYFQSAVAARGRRATPAAPPLVVIPARPHVTRERLGRALAALAVAAFAVPHVAPDLAAAAAPVGPASHAVVAVAQAVVIGVLVGISHRYRRDAWRAVAVGVAASAALAVVELALRPPGASAAAVAAIAAAAAAACAGASRLGARIARGASASAPVTRVLAADYPLVGMVYLLTPALWLLAATARDAAGAGAAACAALFGGSLLASVRASRGPAARGGTPGTVALVAAWTGVSMAPLLAREPAAVCVLVGFVTAVAGATAPWLGPTVHERRFEQRALVRASPALVGAGLLAVISPAPPGQPGATSTVEALLGAPALGDALGAYAALALAAGYAAAELRGRRAERPARAWRRIAPDAALVAGGAEVLRAAVGAGAANVWRAAAAVGAARLGAALYHAYRDHAQALASAGRARGTVVDPAR